jgi:hypothetical protein
MQFYWICDYVASYKRENFMYIAGGKVVWIKQITSYTQNIILHNITKKCDCRSVTKPILPVLVQIIMSLWTIMMMMITQDTMLLPLLLHHQSASHQPSSRSRLLTLNALICKLVLICVRVYWLKHCRDWDTSQKFRNPKNWW